MSKEKALQRRFFEEITIFGGIFFYLFLITLSLILDALDYAIKLVLGLAIIYALTFLIRLFYFKPRPKRVEYNSFLGKMDASSFPSVHAARITLISIFIIFIFKPAFLYIFLAVVVWLLTVYSRIYIKRHYLLDVIGGIMLGIISSVVFFT